MAVAMLSSTPEAEGISAWNLLNFVDSLDRLNFVHSFQLLRHGKTIASGWWNPYSPDTPHQLFSLSKSFTSCAIGFARAEGLLTLDDPVISFFPEKLPGDLDGRFRRMTVRHLLTMSSGHDRCATEFFTRRAGADWVAEFFRSPLVYEPGERFVYNSAATYLLSAVVRKLTGLNLTAYLRPRLFDPLEIGDRQWEQCPQGIDFGGWGFELTTGEIARFAQLLLNHGVLNGKQILPPDYLALATSFQIDNSSNDQPDWKQGYGFQFWRCRYHAFRGDGAFGQYALVMPEQDAVLAVTSGLANMQQILDLVWQQVLPAFSARPLPADPAADRALTERTSALAMPVLHGPGRVIPPRRYQLAENSLGYTVLGFESTTAECRLTLENSEGTETMTAGFDGRRDSMVRFGFARPRPVSATAAWLGEAAVELAAINVDTPFFAGFRLEFSGDDVTLRRRRNLLFGECEWEPLVGKRL